MRSDQERHNHATRKLYDKSKMPKAEIPFVGVDGEGGNVPEDGTLFGLRHQYLSLRAGPNILATGNPLQWWECFQFLCEQPRFQINVAYFFDYDVTMIIRTLPEERARRLLKRGLRYNPHTRSVMPLNIDDPIHGSWEVDYLPHKEFKIRPKGRKWWTVVNDVGQFFQSSFLTTLNKWNIGTDEQREVIRKGKLMRADFAEHNEEIEYYNALECLLLRDLMEEFRDVCIQTGYVPKKWQGPGNLASAMLTVHGVPRRDDIPILKNSRFRELAQAGYYGGRFETTACGPIWSTVYQYDINGAYVHLLRSLPCLRHGSWREVHERPTDGLWFGDVHFNHDKSAGLYNLPVRTKEGHIFYPKEGNGVYWSTELGMAERAGTSYSFRTGWLYESHCSCRPFDFVDDYYAQRLALGKSAKGIVLKLAGNSIYGKLAQSVGYAPWANPVWAGLITAGCRAMLIEAYMQNPNGCYMLATDGLFMDAPLNLPISKKLGEWEETIHPNGIFIVQPGIYFMNDEAKTRGIERGRISGMRPQFEEAWSKFIGSDGIDYTVSVPVQNFITAKQAIARNKWAIAGTWEKTTREISFSWAIKRIGNIAVEVNGVTRSMPHIGGPELYSVPYGRLIGGELGWNEVDDDRWQSPGLAEAARMAEQPDWVEPLFESE
jgi:DNA polymerase type B, organellar and viral